MSTTVGTLEKKVEAVLENLTPEELAKLINRETARASYAQSMGKNQDARLAEINRIYDQHVLTKDWPGYAKFWKAMDEEDIRYWSGAYITSMLDGLSKQEALIALLLLSESRVWLIDYIDWTRTHDPERRESLADKRDQIKGLLQRRQEIQRTMKEVLDAGFWEIWQIPRPTIDMTASEQCQKIFDKIEKWITARDLNAKVSAQRGSRTTGGSHG